MALPADEDAIVKSRAVIVIGPPWVRSGTGRVMQNQIAYYRQRGYLTVFLGVAVDSLHVRSCWVWDVFAQGAPELGAEHVSSAVLEPLRRRDRYARHIGGLLRHRLRGTALNGIVDVARTAKLPDEFSSFWTASPSSSSTSITYTHWASRSTCAAGGPAMAARCL